jgi:hypothetical protein
MLKKLIPAAAVGALALATAFGSAEAAVTKIAATNLAPSAEALVTLIKDGKSSRSMRASSRTGSRSAPSAKFSARSKSAPSVKRFGSTSKRAPKVKTSRRPSKVIRWSRDRRYRYYGPYFIIPFDYWLYDDHPCYDWRYGSRGWGFYWNYARCPL